MKKRLDQILGTMKGVLALHKELNNVLEEHHKLIEFSYKGIQRRITGVLMFSLIAAVVGVVSLLLQLLLLLTS